MRKTPIVNDEYYHIYNRGVDKRIIFEDRHDVDRFFQSVILFNAIEPAGSIFEHLHSKKYNSNKLGDLVAKNDKLVEVISYCFNPNHFHFILRQCVDDGVSKFMKRLSGGYAWYFNNRYDRRGTLFQGPFKAKHIDSNEYLLHLSAYVNLNDRVHKFGDLVAKLVRSSWHEYVQDIQSAQKQDQGICSTDIVLGQFKNSKEYELFARSSLKEILKNKEKEKGKDMNQLLLE